MSDEKPFCTSQQYDDLAKEVYNKATLMAIDECRRSSEHKDGDSDATPLSQQHKYALAMIAAVEGMLTATTYCGASVVTSTFVLNGGREDLQDELVEKILENMNLRYRKFLEAEISQLTQDSLTLREHARSLNNEQPPPPAADTE